MSATRRRRRRPRASAWLGSLAAVHARSPDAVLIAEENRDRPHDLTIVEVNAAFTGMFGYSPSEMRDRPFSWFQTKLGHPAEQVIRAAVVEGRPARLEVEALRKDTTPCRLELTLLPVGEPAAPPCGLVVIARHAATRLAAADACRLAEARFHDAIQSINDGLAICDADDRLVMCNERFLEALPHLRLIGELRGRSYEELVRYGVDQGGLSDDDAKRDPERWIALRLERHRAASGTPHLRQLPDGRWIQTIERRSTDGGIVTVMTDVTPAKQAETRLRDAIESIDAVFTLWDDETRLLMWNKRFPETWPELADLLVPGVTQRALIERNIDRGVLQIPAAERESYIQARLEKHRMHASVVELARADGRVFLIRAYRTAEGGQVRLETDITDLKRRELELRIAKETAEAANRAALDEIAAHKRSSEALSRSQQHLKHAQRIANTGSIERDLITGAVVWSDELYRILGVARALAPTLDHFLDLVHPEDRARIAARMRSASDLKPGAPAQPDEFRIIRPAGDVRLLQAVSEVTFDDRGNAIHLFAALRDITELRAAEARRREMEEQLQHSQKLEALGTLAGGVAHELNNTLVPILALTKITARRFAADSRERTNLDTVLHAGERARSLVQQILAFSRKEAPARQRVDAGALVLDALKMLRATLPSTIRITETVGAAPPVLADPGQLCQIVTNLVTNAAQAIGGRIGRIAVEVGAAAIDGHGEAPSIGPAGAFRLAVSDTGCGMDEVTRRRIFEPFFTTKPVGEGTGLGLAVVHGIVVDHGGRIAVASELGRGTCVEVFLPAQPNC